MKLARLLKLAVVLLLLAVVALPVLAAAKKKEEKKEPMFPNATREEPEIKQSRRLQSKIKKMYDLSQGEEFEKTYAAAEEVLNSDIATPYERSLAAQIMAVTWIDRDDYSKAIPLFERVVSENGMDNDSHFQVMYQVGQLYLSEENYDKALEWMDRFLAESRSTKPDHFAMRGNALYRMERYPEAVEALNKAIASSPDPQPSWYQLLMACYFETDNMVEAAKIAETLLAKNPTDKALLRNLASIYTNGDMNDKAIALLEDAKGRGMLTDERDYKQLYQLYHYAEKEPEAIATIEEGLAKGVLQANLETYRTLAEANYFAEKIPEAIAAYQKAAPLAEDGEISLNLARLLTEEDRWADAKIAVNDALTRGVKRRGDAYIILGAIEFGLDKRDAAIAAYREAAKYPETESMAKSWLRSAGIK